MQEKSEKAHEFFSTKSCLILVKNKSTRQVLKKNLVQMGMRPEAIVVSENYEVAQSHIKGSTPSIIFCSYEFDQYTAIDLLKIHFQALPARQEAFFYIISEREDRAIAATVSEYDIEGFLEQPLTLDKMNQIIGKSFNKKIDLSPYEEKIQKGREFFYQNNFDEARKILEDAKNIHESPVQACYFEGRCYYEEGKFQDAYDQFEEGDAHVGGDYRCLVSMYDCQQGLDNQEQAYQLLNRLKHYPLNPYRIVSYTKACVKNKQNNSALEFILKFDELNFDSPEIKSNLSVILLALFHLYREQRVKSGSMQALDLALKYSGFNPQILLKVLEGYMEVGEPQKVKKYIESQMNQTPSFELKVLKLKLDELDSEISPMEIFAQAMELYNSGKTNLELYLILINKAKKMGRKKDFIDDLIYEALKKFPESEKVLKAHLL